MVPTPHRDGSILDWATDATRAINRFGASGTSGMLVRDDVGGIGFEPLPENRRERKAADAPVPFEVRWSTADGETGTDGKPSGAFVVYLPDGSLECEDNSLMTAWSSYLGDLEPAVADDWYLVPGDSLETGILYLAVTVPVPDPDDPDADPGDYCVEFAQTTDGNLVNVPVADLTVTEATSTAPASHAARQLWVGAVILCNDMSSGSDQTPPDDMSLEVYGDKLQLMKWYQGGHDSVNTIVDAILADSENRSSLVVRCNYANEESGGSQKSQIGELWYKKVGKGTVDNVKTISNLLQNDNPSRSHYQVLCRLKDPDDSTDRPVLMFVPVGDLMGGYTTDATSHPNGEKLLIDVRYDSAYHQLQKKFATVKWENGRLKEYTEGTWESFHQAVEETV